VNNNSILYFLPAKHFNEEEFFITKSIMEKNGFRSFVASDSVNLCEGTAGKKYKHDLRPENIHVCNFAAIILIGGQGARDYWNNSALHTILREFNKNKKVIAAICIAPVILANAGLLDGRSATCFPEVKPELIRPGIEYKDLPVVVSKNIITANGPKASFEFAESVIFVLTEQQRRKY
jgi:protease I